MLIKTLSMELGVLILSVLIARLLMLGVNKLAARMRK